MKHSKAILLSFLLILATAISGCSSGESPALKVADRFDTLAAEIGKATPDQSALEAIEKTNAEVGAEMEKIIEENSDYELTDADKAALKKSMKNFLVTSMKKSVEVARISPDGIDETVNTMMELRINPQIDAAKTLGDLGNAAKL